MDLPSKCLKEETLLCKRYLNFVEKIPDELLSKLCKESVDYAATCGLQFACKEGEKLTVIPHTLFPSPFPRKLYDEAVKAQFAINILVNVMSRDTDFIETSLMNVIKNDSFIKSLLNIMIGLKQFQYPQVGYAAILRSDYMLNEEEPNSCSDSNEENTNEFDCGGVNLKQVEINTISASYCAHSYTMTHLHENMFLHLSNYINSCSDMSLFFKHLEPINDSLVGVVKCIRQSWSVYNQKKTEDGVPCIIIAVQENEANRYDQLQIIFLLRSVFIAEKLENIPNVYILTLPELVTNLSLDTKSGNLMLKINENTKREVSVVYFRCCYTPKDFSHDEIWEVRKRIEYSRAIKIPNIATHLIGSKKFQQILANDDTLLTQFRNKAIEIYPNDDIPEFDFLRSFFAEFHSMDSSEVSVDEKIRLIQKNVDRYVLKPQREGGGNNVYGSEILKIISKTQEDKLDEYVLMSLIKSPTFSNYFIHPTTNQPVKTHCVPELGIWGHLVVDSSDKIIANNVSGHLLRTKDVKKNDGGVSAGVAVLDSPILF